MLVHKTAPYFLDRHILFYIESYNILCHPKMILLKPNCPDQQALQDPWKCSSHLSTFCLICFWWSKKIQTAKKKKKKSWVAQTKLDSSQWSLSEKHVHLEVNLSKLHKSVCQINTAVFNCRISQSHIYSTVIFNTPPLNYNNESANVFTV